MINRFRGEHYFLSNFSPYDVEFEGHVYATAEHAYQASKTLDHELRVAFQLDNDPRWAKREGRLLTVRGDWEGVKLSVMEDILRSKFERHGDITDRLLATGKQRLVEANTWGDTFWGTCEGVGENNLGRLLEKIRCWYACELLNNTLYCDRYGMRYS